MTLEIKKRIITSIFLVIFLFSMFVDRNFLLISVILISIVSVFEFYKIIEKIVKKDILKKYFFLILFIFYITFFDLLFYILTLGYETKLFKNRLELLSEELAEKILFRIPNNKNISELNGVFKSLESESHIILVTSEKMKESLFSKLSKNNKVNKLEKGAVGGEDFKL